MKIKTIIVGALLVLVSVLGTWDQVAQSKEQKLCFDCKMDGGCDPGPNCCIEIQCTNGPWYSCLGGGWK